MNTSLIDYDEDIIDNLYGWNHIQELEHQQYLEGNKMDMTQYAGNESGWLKASDIKGKNIKVVISEVGTIHFEARDGKPEQTKPTLRFEGKEKGIVLNATNTKLLINAYGAESDNWIYKEIGLSTKEYEMGDGIIVVILDIAYEEDVQF